MKIKSKIPRFFLSVFTTIFSLQCQVLIAQDVIYENRIYSPSVRTVLFHPVGNETGFPAIRLRSNDRLMIRFDDMDEGVKNYQYTFVHCNADWTPSRLSKNEYLSGMTDNFIQNYEFSFNTFFPYTHFYLSFPNQNVGFKISGNYLLIIYEDNINKPVITRRFIVYEEITNAGIEVRRPTVVQLNNTHQEVDVFLSHPGYVIPDPYQDLHLTILQNQRWDNAITHLKPVFVQAGRVIYNFDNGENTFPGGNEFRVFDMKNLQVLGIGMMKTELNENNWNVYLFRESPRNRDRYVFWQDINGQMVIRRQNSNNSHIEADYAWVDFQLLVPEPFAEGNVYVWGQLSDWQLLPDFVMNYDYDARAYKAKIFLKQGYYNYLYALQNFSGIADPGPIEGNFWETENEYTVIFYHREIGIRYDRIIGFARLSSRR
ncbi:type IX secretion system plug protein [Schleiferia thermophila]|jgi:hypothetical protein|uniref:Uncharacterized protein DUF5103 n=1 Tax=Schleiferia thermophila TaxID=884107 RepID=A0A369AA10_9FLAO|nr:DUF5103 domain-containing protein [Schleiferia thermophila]KFD38204.1 hypothetical protein AT05_11310 [Schleiferia thermophila str. Yellowstone]RCX05136.1 uncharacterized protein DUF5103 [Schleiferia thermophila]